MDLLALGKESVSPDQPAGFDVRYDPEFDLLQAEIDKLSSPSALDGTDWKKVHDISVRILSEKSKDLFVACCLAVSRIHLYQIDGLADGLTILHDMVTTHWEMLFPPKKRMRGRLGAIEFWIEKTESALEPIQSGLATERWEEIKSSLHGLDLFFKKELPDPPLLTPIERQVNRLHEPTGSKQPPNAERPRKTADDSAASTVKNTSSGESAAVSKPGSRESVVRKPANDSDNGESEKDARKIVQKGFHHIRQAASLIFEENPKDASAYRLRRIEAWARVSALPPTIAEKTQIPPPPPHEIQNIADLRTNRSWQFLLRAAEHKVSQFIFWFDLNRMVAEALINLGEEYIGAHKVVCDETAFLFHRMKGLDRLAFSDGTPFADPDTRQWIANFSISDARNPSTPIAVGGSAQDSEFADQMAATMKTAQDFVNKMLPIEAVSLIQSELFNCRSKKESLLWRMAICRVILSSDNKSMVLPHLELMTKDIDQHHLELWDPELALNVLKTVWSGYAGFSDNQFKDKASEILVRIAKIDPAEAMRIGN